ncbi:hypothetical protein GOP47_0025068 [Adiantum capillus-veneris]|uniref:Transmembrane protein n=1 Tax=Adiantum capillus-veneris TaxID=13818 RepID=A0A9D4U451_ADICA|nr:hypothetical protein GOP47_0025068 [Adiantum capillus-veneris]
MQIKVGAMPLMQMFTVSFVAHSRSSTMMRVAMKQVMEGYRSRAVAGAVAMAREEQTRRFSLFPRFPSDPQQQQEGLPPSKNPRDPENPDPATLREQWRYAISLYSRWYSHAWGTAILAGLSFFAIGWFVKGGNPLATKKAATPPADGTSDTS